MTGGGDAQFLDLVCRFEFGAKFGADDASVPSSWIVVNRTSSFSLDKRLPVAARYASKSSASALTSEYTGAIIGSSVVAFVESFA